MMQSHSEHSDQAVMIAVVGHPNKGKSSIVATLAQDASIAIADESGTTKKAGIYPLQVDGEVLYCLIDTPGFQQPRRVLAWLEQQATSADERPAAVRAFVEKHRQNKQFIDECELLEPVTQGAGLVYVVDGSVPYGPSYEPEMQVLRWTGQPRMALINPIGQADYIKQWQDALGQYFSVVRVFDAHASGFDKQLQLLQAFGQLHEPWRLPMQQAVLALENKREQQHETTARVLAQLTVSAATYAVERDIGFDQDPAPVTQQLQGTYQNDLRAAEQQARQQVQAAYGHPKLDRQEKVLELLEADLFSQASRRVFGLTRAQAASAAATAGASGGAVVDLAVGGLSLGTAAALGGVIGGAAAWAGFDKLARVKVLKLRQLGVRRVCVGPATNIRLPMLVLSRALTHGLLVARRTHARQDMLRVDDLIGDDSSRDDSIHVQSKQANQAKVDRAALDQVVLDQTTLNQAQKLIQPVLKRPEDLVAQNTAVDALTQLLMTSFKKQDASS